MQGRSQGILHTHATNINQSCNPIFLTTNIREMNRSATKMLAIVKKVIETPSVADRRPSILTDGLPLGQSCSSVVGVPDQFLVYRGWGRVQLARVRRPHRLDRSSTSYKRSGGKKVRRGKRRKNKRLEAEDVEKWKLNEWNRLK
jgi:hypothetical protein